MSDAEDPYEVLGVSADATQEQIARAFRRLARRHHPDTDGGDRTTFARIRAAYEALADPRRRARHDAAERAAPHSRRGARIPVRVRDPAPRRGVDITARLSLDLAEAVYGTGAAVELDGGQRVVVQVPAGVEHGQRLRLHGRGGLGRHGGPPGDLLVTTLVADHPVYRRFGRDLHTTLAVSYPEAVLGATVPVTTLLGTQLPVVVPPGTAPGDLLRVPGHGVPGNDRRPAGDLLVEVTLDIPARLDPGQRAALEHLADVLPPPRKEPRR